MSRWPHRSIDERFWSKVDKSTDLGGCWEWRGYVMSNGYGHFKMKRGSSSLAHRFAYGQVAEGLQLDHLCRNRKCVNPSHLEAVTSKENNRRAALFVWEGKCRNKLHDLSVPYSRTKYGACRLCFNARCRAYQAQLRLKRGPQPRNIARGERAGTCKLTEMSVRQIRQLSSIGHRHGLLAKQYGISPAQITRIVQRTRWAHVS